MMVIGPKGKSESSSQGQRMGVLRIALLQVFHRFFIMPHISSGAVLNIGENSPLKVNQLHGELVFFGHHGQILLDLPGIEFGDMNPETEFREYLFHRFPDHGGKQNISVRDDFF